MCTLVKRSFAGRRNRSKKCPSLGTVIPTLDALFTIFIDIAPHYNNRFKIVKIIFIYEVTLE